MKHIIDYANFLNENHIKDDEYLKNIIFDEKYFHLFKSKYQSFHGRYKSGLVVKFYLREYLKLFDLKSLGKLKTWEKFVNKIHNEWHKRNPETNSPILFRGGVFGENENFFCNELYVATVYTYGNDILNTVLLNISKPLIVDAQDNSWMDIPTPLEMKKTFAKLDTVSTDNIVEYAKKCKLYDAIIIKNVWEGSGADRPCDVYITLNTSNVIRLTDN